MADASDCDAFDRAATRENETEKEVPLSQEEEEEEEQQQQQQQHSVLDSVQETAIAQEQPLASAEKGQDFAGSELEVKKHRLLEELESALLPKGKPKDSMQDLPVAVGPSTGVGLGLGLGIEVIDETAVVGTLSLPASAASAKGIGKAKNGSANVAAKKDGSKQSSSRRRAKKDALKQHKIRKKTTPTPTTEPPITITNGNGNGNGKKRRYSRKDMEALRFVNVDQQRTFWNAIYAGLQPLVANEYDTLLAVATSSTNDAGVCLPNKKQAPPILRSVCCENMDGELQPMESIENGSTVDPSSSHSLISKDGCSNLEECSEDDDTDDDYASIQRPAFMVEGKPNFDSGPPEDGWEYLRRVRWEADQIPKVKVAKLDRSKLNKEQSAYMPKIPDIVKCSEHLLPSKQWEDVFLSEFSALRLHLSCLEGSSAMNSSNLQSIHSTQLLGNSFGESASVMNKNVLLHCHSSASKAIDLAPISTSEDKDTTLPLENPGSKTSVDRTSSSSLAPPLLSSILGVDSVARVSMLLKRISSLEPANTISRNDCMWLFALCATVDAPLDADTCAALRSLLRKCASIRAGKAELDEEVVMLNILATISGKYFGQSES